MSFNLARKSRLDKKVLTELLRMFSSDVTATQASELLGLNRKTVNEHFNSYRFILSSISGGTVPAHPCELVCINLSGKIIAVSALKGGEIDHCNATASSSLNFKRASVGRRGQRKIDLVDSFWSYTKARLLKSGGIPRSTFYLHMKETAYRFNHRAMTKKEFHNLIMSKVGLYRYRELA